MEKKKSDTKRTLRLHHYIKREKLRKYLSCILSIYNGEADLGKKTNQFIDDKANLITNIPFSSTTNLYPIYQKNHVTYYPWHQLDSGMFKMNQDVMSTRHYQCFFQCLF